ncbi:MAG: peptide deformylase [Opitutae bacterium]|nr:peptide deformylase [Opitutae bacterium]MBT5689679.1 peptide deformylase [Opitutae bacterium]
MNLKIKFYGESILHKKGCKVETFSEPLHHFSRDMLETMHDASGIGLAAQQVGEALQFCVVEVPQELEEGPIKCILDGRPTPQDLLMPLSIANPVIGQKTNPTEYREEGCLSFPEIRGDVERSLEISVTYQDLKGNLHTLECEGLLARCIQHEVDHLNGTLFIDRMDKKDLLAIRPGIEALKKETLNMRKS